MLARLRLFLVILLAFPSLAPGANAQAADTGFAGAHKQALAEYVVSLQQLATWCANKELFAERDRVFRVIVDLDPDNDIARKGLRYSRKADGSWQDPAPREAKNRNPKALEELPAKRRAAVEPYRTRIVAALEEHKVDATTRRSVQREILGGDPDDSYVRTLQGEAKVGEEWLLAETSAGRKRRAEIKALAQEALQSVGQLHKAELTEMEKNLGVSFTQRFSTRHVRVLGTGMAPECEQAARNCEAVGRFVRGIFGVDTQHMENWAIYLLANEKEETLFLANVPGLTRDFREFLRTCVGFRVPAEPIVAYWDRDLQHRVDGASRQTIGDFLGRAFGLQLNQGWAWEGIGLYLNRELCGTRFNWFIQMTKGGEHNPLRKRLMIADTNWMNEALTLLQKDDHPRFGAMLERDVNTMGIEDMLYAYAFSAYLLEGRAQDVPDILRRIGGGKESSATAVQTVLKMDLPAVEERLYRWLSERR